MKQTIVVTRLGVFSVNENTSLTTLQPFDMLMSHKTGFLAEVQAPVWRDTVNVFVNNGMYRRSWKSPSSLTLKEFVAFVNTNSSAEIWGGFPMPDYVIRPSIKPS